MSMHSKISFPWVLMILLAASFLSSDRTMGFDDNERESDTESTEGSAARPVPPRFEKTAEELANEVIGRDKVQVIGDDAATASLTLDFGTSPGYLLFNNTVQLELELSADQRKELRELRLKFARELAKSIQSARSGGEDSKPRDLDSSDLEKILADTRKRQDKEYQETLLPFQQQRLDQIALQTRMKFGGTSNALASDAVAELLMLTREQRDSIKLRAEDLRIEIAEKINEIQLQADESLLEELTPEQRLKFDELKGTPFRLSELRPLPPLTQLEEEKKAEPRKPIPKTPSRVSEEEYGTD